MKTFKVEIELVLVDEANPDFLFRAINDLLEDGEKMTVARYLDVTEVTEPEVRWSGARDRNGGI